MPSNSVELLKEYIKERARGTLDGILVTPRDPAVFNSNSQTTPREDFYGFQGYPGGNFFSPRQKELLEQQSNDIEKSYAKAHWLDTRNPKIHLGAEGLQYGSSQDLDTNTQQPRPMRNVFPDKSSAQLRGYREMQNEVERELEQMKQEKLQKQRDRDEEKKRDMEMLTSYNPWGRAGGGAPNDSMQGAHFKTKFTEEERAAKNLVQDAMPHDYVEEHGDFFSQFGRPGAGAPLRTESGKLKTEITQDPSIRFQDNPAGRRAFENEVRYRTKPQEKSQYLHELDDQLNYRKLQSQQERIQELKQEIDTLKHDPYGKPGAGAPIQRVPNHNYRRSADHDPELHGEYNPWGKGFGNPRRNPDGEPERYKFSDPEHGVMTREHKDVQGEVLDIRNGRGGAGAPVVTDSGQVMARRITTLAKNDRGDATVREHYPASVASDEELQIFDPFGRSGAGAPIRDARGNIIPNVFGKMLHQDDSANTLLREQNKKTYLHEIQNQMQEQKQSRERDLVDQRAPGGDFASMVKQGQVGKPRRDPETGMLADQRLPMSDITRQKFDQRSWKNDDSPRYHTELEAAAAERARAQRLEKDRDYIQTNHHQDTFSNFFGRQGAGAPLQEGARKQNLENILYSPRSNANDAYMKNTGLGKPQNYVRATIPSTHANSYEAPKILMKKTTPYAYNAPYATVPDDYL